MFAYHSSFCRCTYSLHIPPFTIDRMRKCHSRALSPTKADREGDGRGFGPEMLTAAHPAEAAASKLDRCAIGVLTDFNVLSADGEQ